jgi:hypothetical protein
LCAHLFGMTFMIHAANISGIMLFFHVVATKTYMYKDNF